MYVHTHYDLSINVYLSFWQRSYMLTHARVFIKRSAASLPPDRQKTKVAGPLSYSIYLRNYKESNERFTSSWFLTHKHTQPGAQCLKRSPPLRRRSSGAVWPIARRTGSMFTNCARTATSSPTWDVRTPPAPCSPPPHLSPPTDWLSHVTDRTLWPIPKQECGNLRTTDVDLSLYLFLLFFLPELFLNG